LKNTGNPSVQATLKLLERVYPVRKSRPLRRR